MPGIEPIPTDKFDLIINLALYSKTDYKKANAKLKRVLKTIYVDTRDKTLLHTPASYLAYKRDYWAVGFLMHHGASMHLIAYGAAMAGDVKFVTKLHRFHGAELELIIKGASIHGSVEVEYYANYHDAIGIGKTLSGLRDNVDALRQYHHPSEIKSIARTAAFLGDFTYVDLLRMNFSSVSSSTYRIVFSAMRGGHIDYARQLCESSGIDFQELCDDIAIHNKINFDNYNPNLHNIPWNGTDVHMDIELDNRIKPETFFPPYSFCGISKLQSKQLLHYLTFLPKGKIRSRFIKEINDRVDITKLIAKADRIKALRSVLNYHQCMSLEYSDLMTWFRHERQIKIVKGLDDKIFSLIGTYLAPLSENESSDLNSKLIIARTRTTLIVDLRRHCNTPYPYFGYTEADKFHRTIELSNPYKSPMSLLHREIKKRCEAYNYSTTPEINPYFYVLAKHYYKLSRLPQKDIVPIPPRPDFFTKVLVSSKFHNTTKNVYKNVKKISRYGFLEDFKHSYLEEREFTFFKSRTSVILKKIQNKSLTLEDIKHHIARKKNSRTARLYKILRAQRFDRLVIRDFVTSYRKRSGTFFLPFWSMGRRLTKIRSMYEIIAHAKKYPKSTTHDALRNPSISRYKV